MLFGGHYSTCQPSTPWRVVAHGDEHQCASPACHLVVIVAPAKQAHMWCATPILGGPRMHISASTIPPIEIHATCVSWLMKIANCYMPRCTLNRTWLYKKLRDVILVFLLVSLKISTLRASLIVFEHYFLPLQGYK